MKKIVTIIIVAFIMAAATAHAGEKCSSIREAKKLMELNRQTDAVACLDKMKTDVEANYLLGVIYFKKGSYQSARDRFAAGPVRARYASEIAGLYKAAGDARLNSGDVKQAETMYLEAGNYNPASAKETADNLFAKGKETKNDNFLYLAGKLNPALNQAIGDYYYGLSKSAPNAAAKVKYLAKASEYDNTRTAEYHENRDNLGRFHLDEAKKLARIPGKEKVANENKALAKQYLGAAIVDQEMPEMKVFAKGIYTFELKAGEQTPYWIISDVGGNFTFSSKDYNYKIAFDDGTVIKDGPNVRLPRKTTAKFRFIAITDQPEIKMELR